MPTTIPSDALAVSAPARRRGAEDPTMRIRRRLGAHDGYLALFIYLLVACVWYRTVLAHMQSTCACGAGVDPGDGSNFVWWFEWFVHAFQSGTPLLHTSVIWAPGGINLAGTTTPLLLAALAAPLTLLWGPLPAFNVMIVLAPVGSAWAANRLCRHISGAAWPSLLAGATFGFSSYEIAHLVGQLHLVVMVCPPLVALCAVRLLDGTLSVRRYVIYTGVLLIAQALISLEVLFTGTLVGALGLLVAAATGTAAQRREILGRLPILVLPWLLAGVATLWYTLRVLRAPQFAVGVSNGYPTDLLAFGLPMPYTWFGGAWFAGLTSRFVGGINETSPFLGWPLLLILCHYVWTERRTRAAQTIAIMLALVSLLLLGPILWVDGSAIIRLPDAVIAGLPLFSESLFGRLSAYLALTAAVALSIWLAQTRHAARLRWVLGALAVAALLPNLVTPSAYSVKAWTRPPFFFSQQYTHYLHRGTTILPIPWGYQGESMIWQAQDHMYWKMAGGNLVFPPPHGWVNQATADLWNDLPPQRGAGRPLRRLVLAHHVSDVVVLNTYVARWRQTLTAAGLTRTAAVGGVTLYRPDTARLRHRTSV